MRVFPEWLFLRELRLGTGHRNNFAQRLDAFALNCLPHLAMKRVCYEVKTSRGGFPGGSKEAAEAAHGPAVLKRVLLFDAAGVAAPLRSAVGLRARRSGLRRRRGRQEAGL